MRQSKKSFLKRWGGEILLFGKDAGALENKLTVSDKSADGPEIHFNHTSYHFGVVEEGEILSHAFQFKNAGVSDLYITTRSTCNCTVALTSGKSFAPGATGEVVVEYDTQGKQGHTLNEIFVHTNDNDEPLLKITVAATVSPGIKTVPDRIHLSDLKPGEKITRKILVLDQKVGTLKVQDVIVPEMIEARILPFEEKDDMRYIPVILTIKSGDTVGQFSESIDIITNRAKLKKTTIPITGNIVGSAKIFPPRLYFGKQETKFGIGERSHNCTIHQKKITNFQNRKFFAIYCCEDRPG